MKTGWRKWSLLLIGLVLAGCQPAADDSDKTGLDSTESEEILESEPESDENEYPEKEESIMLLQVNGKQFEIIPESNQAVQALMEDLEQGPISVDLRDYGGFEKVGSLPHDYPVSDTRQTTGPGDLVFYAGDQLVIFYGSNTWAYTRLGHVQDVEALRQALGNGKVTITLMKG